jgi:hypothetical protein
MLGTLNWTTIASLATAAGTLVLAIATFASVRSANNAARTAERAFQVGLRPLLFPSRLEDAAQKIRWGDDHWVSLGGGRAVLEHVDGAVYLAMSLRNVGSGNAVLHSWRTEDRPEFSDRGSAPMRRPSPEEFRPQSRDLFVPPGDMSFWQGAIREENDPDMPMVHDAISSRRGIVIDLLYSDFEDGQRTISRFLVSARGEEKTDWLCGVVRHWNLDRPDPRDS